MIRALKHLLQLLAAGTIYFLLAYYGLELAARYPETALIWPPAGFALAAVLLGGYRILLPVLVAAYLANVASSGWIHAVVPAVSSTLEAFAAAALVNRLAGGRNVFAASASIGRFLAIGMAAAAIGGMSGLDPDLVTVLPDRIDAVQWQALLSSWLPAWFGHAAAMLLITPPLVLWATGPPRSFGFRPLLETGAMFAAAAAIGLVVLGPIAADKPSSELLAMLAVLPLMWAALRRGARDTATASLILLGCAAWVFFASPLPRRGDSWARALVILIGFAIASLALAASAAQHKRTERILRDARKELGKAREQFMQSQKMEAVGQLTGGVAHDFNNLLTVIVGNLAIAQRRLESLTGAPAEHLRRVIGNAIRGAERATAITKHLLAFSRRQPFDPRPLDVDRLIQGLVDFLRRSLGETITLEIAGAEGLWPAQADPVQLEAAMLNLAVNARDAMGAGGKLTIATGNCFLDETYCRRFDELVPGPYVRITVSDTGTGMSKEIRERVFEPFFTTKDAGQGTGLGLSQVHAFARESGGHVAIDSEPGRGTAVAIYLPALPGNVVTEPAYEADAPAEDFPTVLLVEDDHDVRAYAVEALREHYRVLEAHDAESALALVDRKDVRVDLLLTDLVLPGLSGAQLAQEVVARQPGAKVLFMTGYSREAVAHQWPDDMGSEVLRKPLTQEVLEREIRAALARGSPAGQDQAAPPSIGAGAADLVSASASPPDYDNGGRA